MAPTLTVILPPIGRPTLPAALDSCKDADHIIVVTEGLTSHPPCLLDWWDTPATDSVLQIIGLPAHGDAGHTARNYALKLASDDLIAFMDDDDVFLPWAIDAIRRVAALDRPTVFRIDCQWNGVVWKDPAVRFGNVSTQGIVVPNLPDQLGTWGPKPGGDHAFLASTVAKMGDPKWATQVVAVLRPHERPGAMERYL